MRQLVPEDGMRRRCIVGVDLPQPGLGEAGLRGADQPALLFGIPVEEDMDRRPVQREPGELAHRAPRDLRVARQ